MAPVVSCGLKKLRVQSDGVFATPAAGCEMFVKRRPALAMEIRVTTIRP
jgi:hypothetical protein